MWLFGHVALGHRLIIGAGVGQCPDALGLVGLFQLGGQVDRFADHGEFQSAFVPDGAEHNRPCGNGEADFQGRKAVSLPLDAPVLCSATKRLDSTQRICGMSGRWHRGTEGRHDAVTQKLVDASAVALDHRHQPLFVLHQQCHHVVR